MIIKEKPTRQLGERKVDKAMKLKSIEGARKLSFGCWKENLCEDFKNRVDKFEKKNKTNIHSFSTSRKPLFGIIELGV